MKITFYTAMLFLSFLVLSSCKTASGFRNCHLTSGYCNGEIPIRDIGHKYIGESYNGKAHGFGTYTWPNGTVYSGNYVMSKRTGKGTVKYPNGNTYTGDFANGNFNGKGTYLFSNGNIWKGDFQNNKLHGQAVIKLVEPNKENGWVSYEGEVKNNWPDGEGKVKTKDGKIITGVFSKYKILKIFSEVNTSSSPIIKEKTSMFKAKEECADLGFKEKSEKFGECVMELIK